MKDEDYGVNNNVIVLISVLLSFEKMMLRMFFPLYGRSRCCLILLKVSSMPRKQLAPTFCFQPLHHRNYNYFVISNIFNYVIQHLDFKISYSFAPKEVKLSDFVELEDSEIDEKNTEELKKVVTYLLSKGYTETDIKEKFSECLKSKDMSYVKLSLLEDIDSDLVLLLPLLSLSNTVLKLAALNSRIDRISDKQFTNRIYYLSHHLKLEPKELVPALAKHSSLLTMNFRRLDDKMNILKNAKINPDDIAKDLWIFNYKEELFTSRIKAALKAGVELKPWMLRCSEKTFHNILYKYAETKRILGNETVNSYLARRLDCSTEYVEFMMNRNKLLRNINIPKLEQIINFLYEKGYTPQEVRLFPRVFCSSVQSLEKRFEQFMQMNCALPSLSKLCMANKKAWRMLKKVNHTLH